MRFLKAIAEAAEDVVEGIGEVFEKARERRRDRARAIAHPLGLEVDLQARIHGRFDGVPLRRFSRDHGGQNNTDYWTHTELSLGQPLPGFLVARSRTLLDRLSEALGTRDIQIGSPLDPDLWIRAAKAEHDTVRALLTAPGVEPALAELVGDGIRIGLRERTLTLLFRGHHLDAGACGIRPGVRLVRALDRAIQAPWEALGNEPLMTLNPEKTCAEGHLDGVPLRVEVKTRDGRTRTRLTSWLDPPLPPRTEVAHRDQVVSNLELNDPILDPLLGVRTSEIEAVRARLCTDAVRGPLLEILHGHPGSRLRADRVLWVLEGHVGVGLRARVDTVVELIHGLGGGRLPGSGA